MRPDFSRLKGCMDRARAGAPLTLGFLGGSITQGSLASQPGRTYVQLTAQWWRRTFPRSTCSVVNAGIGGTTSHYGAARAVGDLLMYQPDLVILDFGVNDEPTPLFQETYEGLLRKILSWPSCPAVILLHNARYDNGHTAEDLHGALGSHYRLPQVSVRASILPRLSQLPCLSTDGLHPNDAGHALLAEALIALLESVRALPSTEASSCSLPPPLTANAYENAALLTIRELSPALHGFRADPREKVGMGDHYKNGWIGAHSGDRILFRLAAGRLAVQYRKSVCRPALRCRATLDGDAGNSVILDGNFHEDWGDCLWLEPILTSGAAGPHTLELTVLPGQAGATPFYLTGLVTA